MLSENSTENKKNGFASPLNKIPLPLPVNPSHGGRTLTCRAQPRPCNLRDGVGSTAVLRIRDGIWQAQTGFQPKSPPGRRQPSCGEHITVVLQPSGPEPASGLTFFLNQKATLLSS
ncbi:unnamed protein product [Pipistrellus nathusii]|uniref:Uncharacterized protein n=1 Tax=Pipistrellus nathusii TaxID=59473 RepID=A0ABP0AER8_PIPNA